MQIRKSLIVLFLALFTIGCNEDRYWIAYRAAYQEAYDAAFKPAYDAAFAEAYEAIEPIAFEHQKKRLIAARHYSFHPGLLFAAGLLGTLLGFLAQYAIFAWVRRGRWFRDRLDRQLVGAEPSTVSARRETAVKTLVLCVLFPLLIACDGGEARGRQDGERDGRADGIRAGMEKGYRDGEVKANEAGYSRAHVAAKKGMLPEIYVLPIAIMLGGGIVLGVALQYWLIGRMRNGAVVSEAVVIALVPGITTTRVYRDSKAEQERDLKRRLDALTGRRLLPG